MQRFHNLWKTSENGFMTFLGDMEMNIGLTGVKVLKYRH